MERKNGWISVKDALPKSVANKVLVSCTSDTVSDYVGFGHYEKFEGKETWFNLETDEPFEKWELTVTHWQPLPKHASESDTLEEKETPVFQRNFGAGNAKSKGAARAVCNSSIKELDDQINEINESKELVVKFRKISDEGTLDDMKSFMTEEMYHRLCNTPLRETIMLGTALGKMFGLHFSRRTANAFIYVYRSSAQPWQIEIPSYDGYFAKVYIPDFIGDDVDNNLHVKLTQFDLNKVDAEIEKWERYKHSSDSERAAIIFRGTVPLAVKYLRFKAHNLTGKYDNRVDDILTDCYARKASVEQQLARLKTETAEQLRKQNKQLREIAEKLLPWTDTILVYRTLEIGSVTSACKTIHSLDDVAIPTNDSAKISK